MCMALSLSISSTSYSDQYRCPPTNIHISTFDCDTSLSLLPTRQMNWDLLMLMNIIF